MKDFTRLALIPILVAYVALGVLYAVYTPPWQVPDEPAHYNYIRTLAQEAALPVMEPGDYDQAYLERITGEGFPPELSIEPLSYEDHQPPLYYLLAAPIYLLFGGALLPLRLFSVALGLILLLVAYRVIRTLFPDRPYLALVGTGLIAFLPQHLAMMAGVNNDSLAEVMVASTLWMAVVYVKGEAKGRGFLALWGLTLGLAVLTKTSAYVVLPVAVLAVALRARREGRSTGWAAKEIGWVALVALPLAGTWLVRNALIYGWADPLGLTRHNAVVVGQPRSAEWLARYGWGGLLRRLGRTTFHSFWGQFGWMGVPLQPRIYAGLGVLSILFGAGFLGWLLDRRWSALEGDQRDGLLLLAASTLLTVGAYLWYNLTFVQHQGRYLFPALIPLSLGAALGLRWLTGPRAIPWSAWAPVGLGLLLFLWGLVRGDLAVVPTAAAFGLGILLALPGFRPRWGRWGTVAALIVGLVALDIYALFWAILPTLAP